MRGEGMSVLIKGFKMPEDCRECPLEMYYMNCGETRCRAENKILAENFKTIPFDGRPDWCPIVEVPAPHGRLIAADALLEDVRKNSVSYSADDFAHEWVDVQPTVIEAEGRTDEAD